MASSRKLRYGMVGGGPGALIGKVHRRAAALDGEIELVAGAFSSDADKSRRKGRELHLDPGRVYGSYEEMAAQEATLEEERIDFVSVVTPNHLHFDVARAFIEKGFHVVCDKPMTTTLEDAEALCRLAARRGVVFALTHNYSGYPMVKEARAKARGGALGEIRKVVVEHSQEWLATPVEQEGNRQAAWRTDPERAGGAGAVGDIGSHAEHLARYITGLRLESLCADTTTFVEGRPLEDDANMLLRYEGGARGVLCCSQVSVGEENNLRIRVYGTDASLAWRQERPNRLSLRYPNGPEEIRKRGNDYLSAPARRDARVPPGHPEGFIEGFANIYLSVARAIRARSDGEAPQNLDFPTARDGARGVHFIQKAIESGRREAWVDARYQPPGSG